MDTKILHQCPAKKCSWQYVESEWIVETFSTFNGGSGVFGSNLYASQAKHYAITEKALTDHIKTHRWWQLPRNVRKVMKGK
jgi:hypothetical protein